MTIFKTCDDLYETLQAFDVLPLSLTASEMGNRKLFYANWKKVFGCDEAKHATNVVYVWMTEQPIPRLRGSSNIVYIGQTSGSLYSRHHGCAKIESTGKTNLLKYPHIVEAYGKISILYKHYEGLGSSARDAENQLLWWYFQNHFEYPPVNYTKAGRYNDRVPTSEDA